MFLLAREQKYRYLNKNIGFVKRKLAFELSVNNERLGQHGNQDSLIMAFALHLHSSLIRWMSCKDRLFGFKCRCILHLVEDTFFDWRDINNAFGYKTDGKWTWSVHIITSSCTLKCQFLLIMSVRYQKRKYKLDYEICVYVPPYVGPQYDLHPHSLIRFLCVKKKGYTFKGDKDLATFWKWVCSNSE